MKERSILVRHFTWKLSLVSLLVGLLVTSGQVGAAIQADAKPKARLEFTLVATPEEKSVAIEVEDRNSPGKKILVLKQAILDQSSIASAEVIKAGSGNAVSLKMTKEGAALLKEATSRNVNRQMAIVFNGQVIFAPVIRDPIEGSVLITGKDPGLSDKEAGAIVDAIQSAKAPRNR